MANSIDCIDCIRDLSKPLLPHEYADTHAYADGNGNGNGNGNGEVEMDDSMILPPDASHN